MFQTCPLCRFKGSTISIKESYFHEKSLHTIIITPSAFGRKYTHGDEGYLDELEEQVLWNDVNLISTTEF